MDKEFFHNIGFTSFSFGKKDQGDGVSRLVWSHSCGDGSYMFIRLKYVNEIWEVDLIKSYGVKCGKLIEHLMPNKTLEEAINFVKLLGTTDFKS